MPPAVSAPAPAVPPATSAPALAPVAPAAATSRARRWGRAAIGERPAVLAMLFAPTLLAVALDVVVRHRLMRDFPPIEWVNYFGSTLVGAGVWGAAIWLLAALLRPGRGAGARVGAAALLALLAPLAFFCFGAQVHYFHLFSAWMARDTLRLGVELRGTVGEYLHDWGALLAPAVAAAIAILGAMGLGARRIARPLATATPILPLLGFTVSVVCFGRDFVATKGLQPAPPDVCFLHGVVAFVQESIWPSGATRGASLRQPAPLPALAAPAHRPNVLLVVTESVRADAHCSDPAACKARFLDEVAPDRLPLGRLTAQSSGTFTSCMTLWTGLGPDADFATAHRAPLLWEVGRALGYRTAYIGAQNLRYRDFGAYLRRGGIDTLVSAEDLGDAPDSHVGAPDERAAERLLGWIRGGGAPWLAVLHLSNTHWPYRVDPELQPFAPHDAKPVPGDPTPLRNHYRNSVLQQERTVAEALRTLRALPAWDDTLVVFVSDHGEQFREHGGLYHLNVLFDEEVRIPGWLVAGPRALAPEQRDALRTWRARRTYNGDVFPTLLDAMGVHDARGSLPYAERVRGRSLLRPATSAEPIVPLATMSGIWFDDSPAYGVARGDDKLVGTDGKGWACYHVARDPGERRPLPAAACAGLLEPARAWFPDVP